MKIEEIKPAMKAHCYGDVCEVVRVKPDRNAVMCWFTGRTIDGKFGQIKGGLTVLPCNLKAIEKERG